MESESGMRIEESKNELHEAIKKRKIGFETILNYDAAGRAALTFTGDFKVFGSINGSGAGSDESWIKRELAEFVNETIKPFGVWPVGFAEEMYYSRKGKLCPAIRFIIEPKVQNSATSGGKETDPSRIEAENCVKAISARLREMGAERIR